MSSLQSVAKECKEEKKRGEGAKRERLSEEETKRTSHYLYNQPYLQ
jgi:hypothetical protein